MSDGSAKADALVAKAEKKLNGFSLFGNKYEDAQDMLEKAATLYKVSKSWSKCATCYERLATVHNKLNSKHEEAAAYVDAANAYKKISISSAIASLERAITSFIDMGRLSMAAKYYKDIAEMYEQEEEEALEENERGGEGGGGGSKKEFPLYIAKAKHFYLQASELYRDEEQTSSANQCLLKYAQHAACMEEYKNAKKAYESVAKKSLESPLLKYSVKDYLFNGCLCTLASPDSGVEEAKEVVERYTDMDPTFEDQRQYKLITQLTEALEEGDVNAFTAAVQEYDKISRIDKFRTSLLLKVKKKVEEGVEDDLC